MNRELLAIRLERASEQILQERRIFAERMRQESWWFVLRLVMGYSSVVLLVAVMVIASYVLVNNKEFPPAVVTSAGAALFVDVLGTIFSVWKIVLVPSPALPVTTTSLPAEFAVDAHEGASAVSPGDSRAGPDISP